MLTPQNDGPMHDEYYDDGHGGRLDGIQAHVDHFQVGGGRACTAKPWHAAQVRRSRMVNHVSLGLGPTASLPPPLNSQVEAFFKALQKGGKGFSLFKRKAKPPGTPGSAGSTGYTLDDLLLYSNEPIPTSLLKMSNDHMSRAVKMFSGILKYTGDTGDQLSGPAALEIAQKLLHQGLKRPELKDELYMQLIKQTRGNPTLSSRAKAWELFQLVASTMPPSKVGWRPMGMQACPGDACAECMERVHGSARMQEPHACAQHAVLACIAMQLPSMCYRWGAMQVSMMHL